jgi:hypothetical protein
MCDQQTKNMYSAITVHNAGPRLAAKLQQTNTYCGIAVHNAAPRLAAKLYWPRAARACPRHQRLRGEAWVGRP